MRLLRPLALQGDADAQFKVGVMYDQGWRVPQNYTLALACFREAAQQGVAGAQFNLGRADMYCCRPQAALPLQR
jgi:TPR repeat protein